MQDTTRAYHVPRKRLFSGSGKKKRGVPTAQVWQGALCQSTGLNLKFPELRQLLYGHRF